MRSRLSSCFTCHLRFQRVCAGAEWLNLKGPDWADSWPSWLWLIKWDLSDSLILIFLFFYFFRRDLSAFLFIYHVPCNIFLPFWTQLVWHFRIPNYISTISPTHFCPNFPPKFFQVLLVIDCCYKVNVILLFSWMYHAVYLSIYVLYAWMNK